MQRSRATLTGSLLLLLRLHCFLLYLPCFLLPLLFLLCLSFLAFCRFLHFLFYAVFDCCSTRLLPGAGT
eukprot:COSAG02_NODE_15443_length_1171_cov_1.121269_2_plen_69_part_00